MTTSFFSADPHELAAAISQAEGALAHRARAWYVADPEAFASEFVAALRRQGWRWHPALRTDEAWRPGHEPPGAPPPDEYRQARAAMRARPPITEDSE